MRGLDDSHWTSTVPLGRVKSGGDEARDYQPRREKGLRVSPPEGPYSVEARWQPVAMGIGLIKQLHVVGLCR